MRENGFGESVLAHLLLNQITDGSRAVRLGFLIPLAASAATRLDLILRLDGQVDDAALAIDVDDLGFDAVAFVQHVASVFDAVSADLGSLEHGHDISRQLDMGFLGVDFDDAARDDGALVVDGQELGDRVGLELLDAQRDALALRIDREDDRFRFVALLELTNGFFAGLAPGDIGEVNQAVDAAFQTDEDTEVGDRLDGTGNAVALVVTSAEVFPRVGGALLDTQGNTATLFVDVQNHDFDFVTDLNHLGRMDVLAGQVKVHPQMIFMMFILLILIQVGQQVCMAT